MVIIRTRPVAEIIQAVSAASIFGGAVSACACTAPTITAHAAMPHAKRIGDVLVVMVVAPDLTRSQQRGAACSPRLLVPDFRVRRCRSRRCGCAPRVRAQ